MEKSTYKLRMKDFTPCIGISHYIGRNEGLTDVIGRRKSVYADSRTNGKISLLTFYNLGLMITGVIVLSKGIESLIN